MKFFTRIHQNDLRNLRDSQGLLWSLISSVSCCRHVADVKKGSVYSKTKMSQDNADTPTIAIGLLKVEERFDLDFTEQLWTILKGKFIYRLH